MKVKEIDALAERGAGRHTNIDPMFIERWSPRALSGAPVDEEDVKSLIEAARWAPSCFNAQPWRFAFSLAGTAGFEALLDTLVPGNQVWASKSGALIAIASRRRYEHNDKEAATHSFDTGAAWMSMALQARKIGLFTHGMQGFDEAAARQALSLPERYDLPAIIAVGHPGEVSALPDDYQARETPSGRKSLDEILFANNFRELEQ